MDSHAPLVVLKLPNRILPLWAIICDDVRQAIRHWALIAWVAMSLLLAVVWFMSSESAAASIAATEHTAYNGAWAAAGQQGGYNPYLPFASTLVEKSIRIHLILWTTFVIALCASCLPQEADTVGESILCRGVSRWQYLLGKIVSRTLLVVAILWVLVLPVAAMAALRMQNDLTMVGLFASLKSASLLLAGVAVLSVAVGSWFRNPLLGVAMAWMIVYGSGILLSVMRIESASPLAYLRLSSELLGDAEKVVTQSHLVFYVGVAAVVVSFLGNWRLSRRDY